MSKKTPPKKPASFMHLRLDPQLKSLLAVEAHADGRTLSNYVFALIEEARMSRAARYKLK